MGVDIGTISSFGSALVGAVVGGSLTMFVEWRMHNRRNQELLKGRIGELVLDLTMIHSEWTGIAEILKEAEQKRQKRTPQVELWQTLYLLSLPPTLIQIDLSNKLAPLLALKSRAVIEQTGGILSNHLTMIAHIQNYNTLMERYEKHMEQRSKIKGGERFFEATDGDVKEENLRLNLVHHITSIAGKVPAFIKQIEACQFRLYDAAAKHFGSADFLKLPEGS